MLQLKDKGDAGSLAYRLLDEAFDDLIAHRWSDLAKRLGLDTGEVQARRRRDRQARSQAGPALQRDRRRLHHPRPHRREDRRQVPRVPQRHQPAAAAPVARLPGDRARQEEVRRREPEFITQRLNSAQWMIQAIEQRRQTMLKVMNFIVDRQRDFFEKGVEYLKPLTLREVAEVINMHESTVSRVTNEKYVQTPRGVLPLKFFFSSALSTTTGEDAQRPRHQGADPEAGGRRGRRRTRSPTRRSCRSCARRACASRAARWPSTATSWASCRPGCASAYEPRRRPRAACGSACSCPPRTRPRTCPQFVAPVRRGAGARAPFTAEVVVIDDGSSDDDAAGPGRPGGAAPVPARGSATARGRASPTRSRPRGDAARGDVLVVLSRRPAVPARGHPDARGADPGRRGGHGDGHQAGPLREGVRLRASTTGCAAGCSACGSPTSTR